MVEKKRTTVYISNDILALAKEHRVNISLAAEDGIRTAIKKEEWIMTHYKDTEEKTDVIS